MGKTKLGKLVVSSRLGARGRGGTRRGHNKEGGLDTSDKTIKMTRNVKPAGGPDPIAPAFGLGG